MTICSRRWFLAYLHYELFIFPFLLCHRNETKNASKRKVIEKSDNFATAALDATYAINGKAARENARPKKNTKHEICEKCLFVLNL